MNTKLTLSDFILDEQKTNYNATRWSVATSGSAALAKYRSLGSAAKGKLGVAIVASLESSKGHETQFINDEGDLCVTGTKAEVKTSSVTYVLSGKMQHKIESWSAWFNQIRPKQGGWEILYLVTVGCEEVQVYKMSREEFIDLLDSPGEPLVNSSGHIGTKDLAQIRIQGTAGKNKNSHRMLRFLLGSVTSK